MNSGRRNAVSISLLLAGVSCLCGSVVFAFMGISGERISETAVHDPDAGIPQGVIANLVDEQASVVQSESTGDWPEKTVDEELPEFPDAGGTKGESESLVVFFETKPFEPREGWERAVEEIAAYMKAHRELNADFVGNHDGKHRRRAKRAARVVRDMVAKEGVSRRRMTTRVGVGDEDESLGLLVSVEFQERP